MAGVLSPFLARARAWPHARVDMALAALVVLLSALEVVAADAGAGVGAAAVLPVAPVAVAVALRRRHPLPAVLLALVGIQCVWLVDDAVLDALTTIFLAWALVTYTAAVHLGTRVIAGVTALSAVEVVAVSAADGKTDVAAALTGLALFVAAPVAAGRLLRARNRLADELAEQADLLARQRADRVEESVATERVRIAGELHDVVAHALGAMTIQAAVARRMADRDAERAGAAFQAVETTGREALTELRTLMEVLRNGADADGLEPQPGLDALGALAERSRRLGLPALLDVSGEAPPDLPRGVDLTGYRVVQEALAEARDRGGAGRAQVHVVWSADAVELVVVDDGVRSAGRRLVGLQERVRVCGGTLAAGARHAGGHEVRVRLPLSEVPA